MESTPEENERRRAVLSNVLKAIRQGQMIKLPEFRSDEATTQEAEFSLLALDLGDSPYAGTLNDYVYHFEGEEDLLHLFVIRRNGGPLSVHEGRQVTEYLLGSVPKALIWLKPGEYSQHFYVGHDHLLAYLKEM